MAREVENIRLSAANLTYDEVDLGFTGDGINVEITDTTTDIEVDQSLAPVGQTLTKRVAKVTTSLAEWALEAFTKVIPGAVLTVDGTDPTKKRLDIPADGVNMFNYAKPLIIIPVDSESANDHITVWHAIPNVNMKFAFTKDKVRYYSVEFTATKGTDGKFITFGDTTVTV